MTDIEAKGVVDQRAEELAAAYGSIDNELPFIPPLRMAQKTSDVVGNGKVKLGEWYFNQDTPLGNKITVLVYDHRLHGLKIQNKEKVLESYNVVYEDVKQADGSVVREIVGDADFLTIKNGVDDNKKGVQHLWGPELLIYICDIGEFAILFLNKASSRKHWTEFLNPRTFDYNHPKPCVASTNLVDPPKLSYSWYEPNCRAANQDESVSVVLPSPARIEAARKKFIEAAQRGENAEEGEAPPER